MSNEGLLHKQKAEQNFTEWYAEGLKSGDIPLEFGGAQGRKALLDAFNRGCGHIVAEMVMHMLTAKLEKKP